MNPMQSPNTGVGRNLCSRELYPAKETLLSGSERRLVLGMHDGPETFAHVLDDGKHFRWAKSGRVEQLVGGSEHKPPYWRKAGSTDTRRICDFVSENAEGHGRRAVAPNESDG